MVSKIIRRIPVTNYARRVRDVAAMLWLRILYIHNVISYDKRFVLLHYYFPK